MDDAQAATKGPSPQPAPPSPDPPRSRSRLSLWRAVTTGVLFVSLAAWLVGSGKLPSVQPWTPSQWMVGNAGPSACQFLASAMTDPVVPIPAGIADPRQNVAVIEHADGHLECLDLKRGARRAKTDFAAVPLTLFKGGIIGWRSETGQPDSVVIFLASSNNTGSIQPRWETRLPLPSWVQPQGQEAGAFRIEARVGNEDVVVSWEAHSRYQGGPPPSGELERAARNDGRGTFRLEGQTGAILRKEQEAAPQTSQPSPAWPNLGAGNVPVAYRFNQSWLTRPWQSGTKKVYLARSARRPGVFLVREPSTAPGEQGWIQLSNNPEAIILRTLDQRHLVVQDDSEDEKLYTLYAVETAEDVLTFRSRYNLENATVTDDALLYTAKHQKGTRVQVSLESRSLADAVLRWSYSLGEERRAQPPPLPQ